MNIRSWILFVSCSCCVRCCQLQLTDELAASKSRIDALESTVKESSAATEAVTADKNVVLAEKSELEKQVR